MDDTPSPKFSINKTDMKKVATGAAVAMSGALITYLVQTIPDVDFGTWTPVVVALFGILVNFSRKWIAAPDDGNPA